MKSFREPRAGLHHRTLEICLVTAGIALTGAAIAQSAPIEMAAAGATSQATPPVTSPSIGLQNGYAENLRPTVRRKARAQSQPYAPIKKQDDDGQIPEVDMFVGESRVFPTPNVGRIAVGNGQIMSAAALDNKEVIVFANSPGTSSLFIWNADGRYQRIKINIVAGDTSRVAREVAAFLTTIPHAKASVVGDKVIVEGDNLSDADLTKIEQLEKRYPQLVNFTNKVGWEQMVMMDIKVVEFPKTELRELGMKWGSVGGATLAGIWSPVRRGNDGPYTVNIPAPGSGLPITSPVPGQGVILPTALNILSGLNLGINAQLNLLEQNGQASILAEPQLSARNGAEASFLAGGEFPYSVASITGVTVQFKPYGIKLNVTPKVDRNGVIRAVIKTEVSSLDNSVTTSAGPALLTRKTDTEFNVRSGETIVLSGLLQRNTNTDIDKVPLLGDVPILGALFRSKRFQNKETELVIFVTPTVVDSHSPGLVERVKNTTERLEQQMGPQPYLTQPLQPGANASDFNRAKVPAPAGSVAAPAAVQGVAPSAVPTMLPRTSATKEQSAVALDLENARTRGALMQVVHDASYVREAPNFTSAILLPLGRGAIVELVDTTVAPKSPPAWQRVRIGTIQGWIAGSVLAPLHSEAPIRPRMDSDVSHLARHGQPVGMGAIATAIMPAEPVQGSVPLTGTARRYKVNLDGLALRVAPDVNAMTVVQLNLDSEVEGLPEAPRGHWVAVQVAGKRGWVPLQWLIPASAHRAS